MRFFQPLLVLVLVFGTIEAGRQLLGSEKCTWGPSYWCSGLKQSSKCQATRHCIDRVWSTNPYPEDDDDVCKICKEMVKEARDQLNSNETQGELIEVFEGSCALIPIKIIADECKKLVDEFVPELVETLSSEMNPDTVCTVAGLCNSKRIDKMLAKFFRDKVEQIEVVEGQQPQASQPQSDCDVCKVESKKLSKQIYDADKDLVLDKILELCGYASTYADACKAMALENFDDIYWILTNLDDGLCDLSGMCPAVTSTEISTIPQSSDVQCEFCEKVIQHWIDTWTANTTQEEFKEVLEALCNKMKPDRRDHCLHIVDHYYIPIFNYILHELDPKMLCTLAGLCNGENRGPLASNNAPITVLLTSPAGEETPSASENRLIGGYFVPQTAVIAEKPGCVICEYVIHHLQDILAENNTAEAVEEALEKVCSYLPKSVGDQCENLVEKYGTGIIEVLSRGVDPKEVCTILDLCSQESDMLNAMPQNALTEMKQKDDNCALCQYAMETVFEMLENKENEDEVKNLLETVCRFMPASIEDKCEEYIEAYAETILQFILKSMTPDEICAELGLCEKTPPKPEITMTENDSKCVLCEYVMSQVKDMLSNKTTEAEVRKALDEVCSYLPSTISDQCTKFVDQYSDMIIDFITHNITPEQICQQIGLCQVHIQNTNAERFEMLGEVDEIIEVDIQVTQETSDDRPYCTLCEYAIGEVDKMITDKKNVDEIKHVLDEICYELSNPIRDECVKMVNQYTDEIVQMFVAEYTPQEVCSELGLCDPPKTDEINDNTILQFEQPEENDVSEKPLCALCEFAMDILEKQILTNRTLDMAEHAIEMLCSYMPETIGDKCIDFVQEYGDQIINLIIEAEMSPDQVCGALTLCTSQYTTWDASPVGGHRCTWGPAFWCQSRIHARACGTTRHCEDNVWNE